MDISCAFPANSAAVEQAVLAEELGYERVWIYDSPALYHDVWVTLARIAERTERIGIGPGVLVPHLRHPMTQAAAITTLDELAPGRLAVALGAGFTGRLAMGQRMLTRREFELGVRQVMALLRGEVVEVDGAATQMLHSEGFAPSRPIEVPVLVNAQGPRGQQFARDIGSGVTVSFRPVPGFSWCAVLSTGTVLEPGESPTSARAFEATAPSLAGRYHGLAARGEPLDPLPGGEEWAASIAGVPEGERHLEIHRGHLVELNEHDRRAMDRQQLPPAQLTGTVDAIRERLARLEAGGATELMWQPMGPDIEREMRAFAQVLA
ncbi:MAG: LLM class flavin-dependent oxidoreductase [Dehalococcoidia bacterium]|nr:LLM class flavin-dependent oxidoreductase [Dehalococcoidia bacterium]